MTDDVQDQAAETSGSDTGNAEGSTETNQTDSPENQNPEESAPRLTRAQRRAQQKQQKQQKQKSDSGSDNPSAPDGMFKKPVAGPSNPTRVKIIKAHIDTYSAECGSIQTDPELAKQYFTGLFNGISMIFTLSGQDLNIALTHLNTAIIQNKTNAFSEKYLYRYVPDNGNRLQQISVVRFLIMAVRYAKLSNKSELSKYVDINYSVSSLTNKSTADQIANYYKR